MDSSAEEDDVLLPKEGEEIVTRHEKYKVAKLLGKGGYGAVYNVTRAKDNKPFAIKCEKMSAGKKVLAMDCKVLCGAQKIKSKHFCSVLDRGKLDARFAFLVMQLIGKNLWDLRVERDTMRFTLGTSLKSAAQCLICIEELHRIGFLHRDIKPGNFAAGRVEEKMHHIIYMLDFGLCRQFQEKDKDCRKQREVAPFRGTTRYAPLAAMKQVDQSRKDDIEGWLYMVAEWTSGALPWKKYNADNRTEVMKMKEELRTDEKAMDKFLTNCPKREFTRILKYVDELTYYSVPDYVFVYKCIEHAMKANNIKWSDPLDWDEGTPYMAPKEEPGDGRQIKLDDDEEDKDFGKDSNVQEKKMSKEKDSKKTKDVSKVSSAKKK